MYEYYSVQAKKLDLAHPEVNVRSTFSLRQRIAESEGYYQLLQEQVQVSTYVYMYIIYAYLKFTHFCFCVLFLVLFCCLFLGFFSDYLSGPQ